MNEGNISLLDVVEEQKKTNEAVESLRKTFEEFYRLEMRNRLDLLEMLRERMNGGGGGGGDTTGEDGPRREREEETFQLGSLAKAIAGLVSGLGVFLLSSNGHWRGLNSTLKFLDSTLNRTGSTMTRILERLNVLPEPEAPRTGTSTRSSAGTPAGLRRLRVGQEVTYTSSTGEKKTAKFLGYGRGQQIQLEGSRGNKFLISGNKVETPQGGGVAKFFGNVKERTIAAGRQMLTAISKIPGGQKTLDFIGAIGKAGWKAISKFIAPAIAVWDGGRTFYDGMVEGKGLTESLGAGAIAGGASFIAGWGDFIKLLLDIPIWAFRAGGVESDATNALASFSFQEAVVNQTRDAFGISQLETSFDRQMQQMMDANYAKAMGEDQKQSTNQKYNQIVDGLMTGGMMGMAGVAPQAPIMVLAPSTTNVSSVSTPERNNYVERPVNDNNTRSSSAAYGQ